MTKSKKPLPCPICGQTPAVNRQPEHFYVYCNGNEHCLTAEARKTEKEAIALWNKWVCRCSKLILVHYDMHEGSEFEAFYTLEAAHKNIAKYIKKNGGKEEWDQRNERVWEHGGGEDFINLVDLRIKDKNTMTLTCSTKQSSSKS